jgi:glycine/D-amino acid oxidase-like deaminating enzyme
MAARGLYDDEMYRFNRPEPSYWQATGDDGQPSFEPLTGNEACDVAIIGGGYTGVSAAYHLSKHHGLDARVLEAGQIGWGASGRNAGFCSIGGTSLSLDEMLNKYGIEDTRKYYSSQVDAIALVRSLIKEEGIDASIHGDAELEVAPSRKIFAGLTKHAEMQRRLLKLDTRVVTADQFREKYFDSSELCGAVVQRPAFGLHPLRYMRGLAAAARRNGATLYPYSEVLEWGKEGNQHRLQTDGGSLRARIVILATNGFMPEHLHPAFRGRPLPMVSAIVVTRPLSTDERDAHHWRTGNPAISARRILNYYRLLPDNRLLFGGRGHSTGSVSGAARTFATLQERFGKLWPHWRDVAIEYRWHGLICITLRLTPSIGRLDDDPSVLFAYGYHGNGLNTATWSGKQLADWIAHGGDNAAPYPDTVPAMLRGISGRFPVAALRLRYLQARLAICRLQDALD